MGRNTEDRPLACEGQSKSSFWGRVWGTRVSGVDRQSTAEAERVRGRLHGTRRLTESPWLRGSFRDSWSHGQVSAGLFQALFLHYLQKLGTKSDTLSISS